MATCDKNIHKNWLVNISIHNWIGGIKIDKLILILITGITISYNTFY